MRRKDSKLKAKPVKASKTTQGREDTRPQLTYEQMKTFGDILRVSIHDDHEKRPAKLLVLLGDEMIERCQDWLYIEQFGIEIREQAFRALSASNKAGERCANEVHAEFFSERGGQS